MSCKPHSRESSIFSYSTTMLLEFSTLVVLKVRLPCAGLAFNLLVYLVAERLSWIDLSTSPWKVLLLVRVVIGCVCLGWTLKSIETR